MLSVVERVSVFTFNDIRPSWPCYLSHGQTYLIQRMFKM